MNVSKDYCDIDVKIHTIEDLLRNYVTVKAIDTTGISRVRYGVYPTQGVIEVSFHKNSIKEYRELAIVEVVDLYIRTHYSVEEMRNKITFFADSERNLVEVTLHKA